MVCQLFVFAALKPAWIAAVQAATGSRPAPPVVVLPALPKSAIKPLLPASPVLACAVKDAREGLSSYQVGAQQCMG